MFALVSRGQFHRRRLFPVAIAWLIGCFPAPLRADDPAPPPAEALPPDTEDPAAQADIAPQYVRTPEEIAAEQAYAAAQAAALAALSACVGNVRSSGFLGFFQDDPTTACAAERAGLAPYLPVDKTAALLDEIQDKLMNGESL